MGRLGRSAKHRMMWRAVLSVAAGMAASALPGPPVIAAAPTGASPSELTTPTSLVDPSPQPARSAKRVASGNPLWAIPLSSLTATREHPLFSPSRRPPPPPVVAATYTVAAPPPPKPPEPDHPALTLVGTIVGKSEGIGVFLDQTTNDVVRIKTGQDHAGWTLRSVSGREVEFQNARMKAVLSLPAPGQPPVPVRAAIGNSVPAAGGNTWQDGDGQMIAPPLGQSLPPAGPASVQVKVVR